MPSRPYSRSEQGGRYDADAVGPAVGVGARRHDDGVQNRVTELVLEPSKVAQVVVSNRVGQLHLDGEHSAVAAFDDEVDLVLAAMGSQMADACLCCPRVPADAKREQRLEQLTEQRPVPWRERSSRAGFEQGARFDTEQPRRERGIGQVMA